MDDLELLKNDWKKEKDLPNFSKVEILKMIKSKSVSVSKTLFIYGIIEAFIWLIISYYDSESNNLNISFIFTVRTLIFFSFLVLIIVFKNRINASSNSNDLMKSILNLRKLVFFYVVLVFITVIIYFVLNYDEISKAATAGYIDGWNGNDYMHTNINEVKINIKEAISIVSVSAIFLMGIMMGIYYITYGELLKKLKENYRELTQPEFNN